MKQLQGLLANALTWSLNVNDHKACYQTVEEVITACVESGSVWASSDSEAHALAGDSFVELQWYPHTPIGSYSICAATVEEILEWAARQDASDVNVFGRPKGAP